MRLWMKWAAGAALALGLAVTSDAQQRDPFGGRFGSMEIAFPPAEAANQVQLMSTALAGLQPQRPGTTDVYVVSISLWAEPVFEREASQAGQILTDHFAAQGRSIVLSQGTGEPARTYPAATPNNIQAALGRIGALMDPNEDLLVLFVTSHGSQDGAAAIQEQNRLGGALRPTNLRDSLQQAGIRNRVVIVSACFSGAFVAPLMDPNTIVLTAASSDRTSFGCQPNREWTYFGDAYFNRALRGGAGVVAGFDQANQLIRRWETEQRLTPSQPQRYVGAQAAQMVQRLERARR